jgi:hypothetical protein
MNDRGDMDDDDDAPCPEARRLVERMSDRAAIAELFERAADLLSEPLPRLH